MADTVKEGVRSEDIVIRYRGDEFVVILPDTGTDMGKKMAEILTNKLTMIDIKQFTDGSDFKSTWSAGIATYPVHGDDPKIIISVTFQNMLIKRESGGNGVQCAGQ